MKSPVLVRLNPDVFAFVSGLLLWIVIPMVIKTGKEHNLNGNINTLSNGLVYWPASSYGGLGFILDGIFQWIALTMYLELLYRQAPKLRWLLAFLWLLASLTSFGYLGLPVFPNTGEPYKRNIHIFFGILSFTPMGFFIMISVWICDTYALQYNYETVQPNLLLQDAESLKFQNARAAAGGNLEYSKTGETDTEFDTGQERKCEGKATKLGKPRRYLRLLLAATCLGTIPWMWHYWDEERTTKHNFAMGENVLAFAIGTYMFSLIGLWGPGFRYEISVGGGSPEGRSLNSGPRGDEYSRATDVEVVDLRGDPL